MNRSFPLPLIIALSVLAMGAVAPSQREALPFAPADADRFVSKLAGIIERGESAAPRVTTGGKRTVLTEPELNAYLAYHAQAELPAGVVGPYVWALGEGRLTGSATVDLDKVRTSRSRGWLDPMRLLRGTLPVSATGVLRTVEGVGTFQLESARVGSLPVPLALLQELVTFYSRTAENPGGINLDEPFVLPAAIRRIDVEVGQAVVVQ